MIKAKYINIRSLSMVKSFLWHEPDMEKEPFEEAKDCGREILLLPTLCTTSRERDCPRPNLVLLISEHGYNQSHPILE